MAEQDKNLLVIDADSLVYIVGYKLMDMLIEPIGIMKLDEYITDMMTKQHCGSYIGFYGGKGGKNFRYDLAKTNEYKRARRIRKEKENESRKEKIAAGIPVEEDWYEFWEPVLKEHMRVFWKFEPVFNIEADDACIIAKRVFEDKYDKVIIATPDKDLKQEPGNLYDYKKNIYLETDIQQSKRFLASQMIEGDSADSIVGLFGAGESKVDELLKGFEYTDEPSFMKYLENIYIHWHTVTLHDKLAKKQEKIFLVDYKAKNDVKRFTKATKSDALAEFKVDTTSLLSKKEAVAQCHEMYSLLHMLTTEEEGKKHGFILTDPLVNKDIDWSEIIDFDMSIELTAEEEDFDFLDDL